MKKTRLLFLFVLSCTLFVKAETFTNNVDLQNNLVINHGYVNAGDSGLTFTNSAIRGITISAGQLSGVDPETGNIITNVANLLPLKVQSLEVSGGVQFSTNVSISGDLTLSGEIASSGFIGDGSGLTNLNAVTTEVDPVWAADKSGYLTSSNAQQTYVPKSGGVITGALEVDSLTVHSNLNVEGTISGDASGLTGVPAGGNDGELQFNNNGVLSGNTNYYFDSGTGELVFRSPKGEFCAYHGSNLIYSVQDNNGRCVVRLFQNTNESIRLSGDGEAYIAGSLQVDGQLSGDGSGLTNLPGPSFSNVIFFGENQMLRAKKVTDVTYVGIDAGQNSINDTNSVFVGARAGQFNDARSAVFVGEDAGRYNTGSYAVGVGHDAGRQNAGDYTLMLMRDAGWNNSGDHGILLGQLAGRSNRGHDAKLIGRSAGYDNRGDNVIMIGESAGLANMGDRVIALGKKAGYTNAANDRLFIDMDNTTSNTLIYGEFDNDLVRINGDLDVTGTLTGDGSGLVNLNAVTTEADPVFVSSVAANITTNDIANWNSGSSDTLLLDGSRAMQADLNMGGHSITNISTNSLVYADGQSVRQTYVDAAGDTVSGDLTVNGQFVALYLPPQGDLTMGSYTNGLPQ